MLITSIGSVCFCKWQVCKPTGLDYLHCPLDNAQNNGVKQFDNILELLKQGYKQIEPSALEYREHKGARLDNGKMTEYHGYKYIGDELSPEFILPHFFDDNQVMMYLTEEEAWGRWSHKCEVFEDALKSREDLALVSLRLEDDAPEARAYLWESLMRLEEYVKTKYGRTEDDTRVLSLIATDVEDVKTEFQTPMAVQILIPSGEELGLPYWKRAHRDIYKDVVLKNLDLQHRQRR